MEIRLQIEIELPPEKVYLFLRDKHQHIRPPNSPVRRLDLTTPGEVTLGSRFIEVVRMVPGYDGVIESEVVAIEPGVLIVEQFTGPAMQGELTYRFEAQPGGMRLTQIQSFCFSGLARFFQPVIRLLLIPRLRHRMQAIKFILEADSLG